MFNQAPDRLLLRDTPDAMESVKIATHTWPYKPFPDTTTRRNNRHAKEGKAGYRQPGLQDR